MRLAIPLLPWSISVVIERRSRQSVRWRFRLRTVLIVVAITALFMGAWMAKERHLAWKRLETEWERRAQEYEARAAMYAKWEVSHLTAAGTGKSNLGVIGDGAGYRELRIGPNEHKRLAAERGRLKRKYARAAATPWLPVESSLEAREAWRIADEQGAPLTPEPPSWVHNPVASAAPSNAAVSSGQ
jgi:hypothetical protein